MAKKTSKQSPKTSQNTPARRGTKAAPAPRAAGVSWQGWTATVTNKVQASPTLVVFSVQFTRDATGEKRAQDYRLSDPNALAVQVRNTIAAWVNAEAAASVPVGPINLTPTTPPPAPVDATRTKFRADIVKLWRLLDAVTLGLVPATAAPIVNLRTALTAQLQGDATLLELVGKPFAG